MHHVRELQVGQYEAEIRRHREWMRTKKAKEAYKRRKEIEASFGIIKEIMGVRRWLLRGWINVKSEANTVATAFNLRKLYLVWRSWSKEEQMKLVISLQEMGNALSAINKTRICSSDY